MRETSSGYNPFPIVRDVDCHISFRVVDQNAKKSDTVVEGSPSVIGNLRDTVNDIYSPSGKFVSLEHNMWALDGTFDIMERDSGYWTSEISGVDGYFGNAPYVKYSFSFPISTLGITLHFDDKSNQYASRVRFTFYSQDGGVIDTWEADSNEAVQMHQKYVGDYYALRVDFLRTSEPYRRIRLAEIDFGLTKSYTRNSLGTVRVTYDMDLLCRSLPTRELVFTFDNSSKNYNLLNPDGVYQYLQDGQLLSAQLVIRGESVNMGEFYFTKADAAKSGILPEITAHDRVYILDNDSFDNGRAEDVTLSTAITEVLSGYNIPVRYIGDVSTRIVSMTISQSVKRREAVRILAQAARCTAYVDRDGYLTFADYVTGGVPDAEMSRITADELLDYNGVSISDRVDGVRLTVQDDYRVGKDGTPGRQVNYYAGDQTVAAAQISLANSCIADSQGQIVADWMLKGLKMRKQYAVPNRCDPAVELGDVVRVDDIFQNHECAVITGIDINYDGTLTAITKGTGE